MLSVFLRGLLIGFSIAAPAEASADQEVSTAKATLSLTKLLSSLRCG